MIVDIYGVLTFARDSFKCLLSIALLITTTQWGGINIPTYRWEAQDDGD